jgi:hypothetical protein
MVPTTNAKSQYLLMTVLPAMPMIRVAACASKHLLVAAGAIMYLKMTVVRLLPSGIAPPATLTIAQAGSVKQSPRALAGQRTTLLWASAS